ncbi:hypothetical protein AMS68_002574 [Peltaster fructicola]|uniref:COP9 signalosome complex subunit 4 n=1 Tax=Peltaster fructicola TaxID=286661 RepID=A0A6H0XQM1_9PEZI|nr:hypothetical protein AMS68_002574 [Peltaster fructicola]
MTTNITNQLEQLSRMGEAQQRNEGYNKVLQTILDAPEIEQPELLIAYVGSIISDQIGVLNSRPLLSTFVEAFRQAQNSVKLEAGPQIINLLNPRIVSYEQQDTDIKFILADAYEAEEDFANSAKTLQGITLDSTQRAISNDDKARTWIRIVRCYLEEDDPTNAVSYLNRIKQIIYNVTDQVTRLQFQLSQARISDSQRSFLDASAAYYTLSNETAIDEEERLHTLSAAITCAVLAPAGPLRARQLGTLYKDERALETPEYSILEKIYLDRLLTRAEVEAFAAGLKEHQLAKTSDGSTVLDKAVLEHNLLAVSRLYRNITFDNLGTLLGVEADRAETYAAGMIESNRLSGSIDQIDSVIHFNIRDGDRGAASAKMRAWDENIQNLAEEVEKVATLLQREEPQWYEAHVAA